MRLVQSSQAIVDRLLANDYDGDNAEVLRDMDLNELSSNLSQIGDAFTNVKEAANTINNTLCVDK